MKDKLKISPTREFAELIKRAEEAAGNTSLTKNSDADLAPIWKPQKWVFKRPCLSPDLCDHDHEPVSERAIPAMLAFVFLYVICVFVLSLVWDKLPLPVTDATEAFLLCGLTPSVSGAIVLFFERSRYRHWMTLQKKKDAPLSLAPAKSTSELVLDYLHRDVEKMRTSFAAELQPLKTALSCDLDGMRELSTQFGAEIATCADERFLPGLQADKKDIDDLIARCEQSRQLYEEHQARLKAYFVALDAHVRGFAAPFRYHALHERAADFKVSVPKTLADVEEAILSSICELEARNEAFRARLQSAVPQAVASLTASSRQDLPQALDACDAVMTEAFRDLPQLPVASSV